MSKEICEKDIKKYYYNCQECNSQFKDIDEHVREFHPEEEVMLVDPKYEEKEIDTEEYLDEQYLIDEEVVETEPSVQPPPNNEPVVLFAFDPITKKCKKLTFSASPTESVKSDSLDLKQFRTAFSKPPVKPPPKVSLHRREEQGQDAVVTECPKCFLNFGTVGAYVQHKKVHGDVIVRSIDEVLPEGYFGTGERYFCEICQRSLDMEFKELHIAAHNKPDTVCCSVCNRQFENQILLQIHMDSLPDHSWTNFGKKYVENSFNLGQRPFACSMCSRRFKRASDKCKHERIHEGARPHQCEICLKTFRTSNSLRMHLRNHTSARPHACTICERRFLTSGNCKAHIESHFKERNYHCLLCPKTYKTAKTLSMHKNQHSAPTPHKCPKCSRRFFKLKSVEKHLLTHDKQNPIVCKLCDGVFSRKDWYRIHLEKDHNLKEEAK